MKYLQCPGIGLAVLCVVAPVGILAGDAPDEPPPVAALHRAVIQRDADETASLLAAGAPVNDRGPGDWTALHLAARQGWAEGVDLLIGAGADPDGRDRYGWTPLHMAAYAGHVEAAERLRTAGADVDAFDERGGLTPLHRAALRGNADMVRWLIAQGAEVDARSRARRYGGMTPLHWAAGGEREGNTRCVALLLDAGADATLADDARLTALHWAVLSHRPETVARLLDAGASIHARDDRGETPVDFARSAPEAVRKLLIDRTHHLPTAGWRFRMDPQDAGRTEGWYRDDADDSDWDRIAIGLHWQDAGFEYLGAAWYRRSFRVDDGAYDQAHLLFHAVDGDVSVWMNGEYVGSSELGPRTWEDRFSVDISGHVRAGEVNRLVLRVEKNSHKAGVWQPIELKPGLP